MTSEASRTQILVSIGVPVHNGASTVARQLKSLSAQTYDTLEIIVLLNNCTDESLAVVSEHARDDHRIRVVQSNEFLLASDSFAAVAYGARGDYFMWAADDDELPPDYVKVLLHLIRESQSAGGFTNLAFRSQDGRELGRLDFVPKGSTRKEAGNVLLGEMIAGVPLFHGIYGLWETSAIQRALPAIATPMSDLIFCGKLFFGRDVVITGNVEAIHEISTLAPNEKYPNDASVAHGGNWDFLRTLTGAWTEWMGLATSRRDQLRIAHVYWLPLSRRVLPQLVHDASQGSALGQRCWKWMARLRSRRRLPPKSIDSLSYGSHARDERAPSSRSN